MADEPSHEVLATRIAEIKTQLSQAEIGKSVSTAAVSVRLTDIDLTLAAMKKDIADIHKEVTKAPVVEWLEAAGFNGFAAGLEKLINEKEGFLTYMPYFLSAAVGLIIPAIGVILTNRIMKLQRDLQQFDFSTRTIDPTRQIRATSADGMSITRQNRDDVENREDAAAGGLGALPQNANFDNLRDQLSQLNPHLATFNQHAPDFTTNFRKLPSERAAKKAGEGIKRVAEALTGVDHSNMTPIAKGIQKIKDAMEGLKPREVEKVAKATRKLNDAMEGFDPKNLPKANKVDGLATKMSELATATGTLRTKFEGLRGTIQSLDQEIGAASSA
ncbi:hypothetical protein AB0A60_01470 [Streptomyces sp. NPDC046275]|uniref:hypothetical protein n=1 Tax=Streptomyces sp. NPDC046275 TaxID=3157201 RepID=UPI0033DBFEC1